MHVAHQELFAELDSSGAVLVIENGPANLTPGSTKLFHTSYPIYICPLHEVRDLEGHVFIEVLQSNFPSLELLVVGYDFRFGKDRQYCAEDLPELFSGTVKIIEEIRVDGISVHSGVIRELIRQGDVRKANRLLSRPYTLEGIHIRGQGIGAKELVPTINLAIENYLLPSEGVYASKTYVEDAWLDSVTFVGHRVSTDRKFSVESHILDGEVQADGMIKVAFFEKLRDNKRYTDMEALKQQILEDIFRAREYLEVQTMETTS